MFCHRKSPETAMLVGFEKKTKCVRKTELERRAWSKETARLTLSRVCRCLRRRSHEIRRKSALLAEGKLKHELKVREEVKVSVWGSEEMKKEVAVVSVVTPSEEAAGEVKRRGWGGEERYRRWRGGWPAARAGKKWRGRRKEVNLYIYFRENYNWLP